MKHLLTISILLISHIVFSQTCDISEQEYKSYLFAINEGNKIYSLDSIKCNGNEKYITLKKDENHNISEAIISLAPGPNFNIYNDSISVEYYNNEQIERYLKHRNFWNEVDTAVFQQFDTEGRLLVQQDRFELWCATGGPYDEEKTINSYNELGDLIHKKKLIKWNYDFSNRPYDKWVDYYEYIYEYDNGNLVKEMTLSNYFNEGEDSVHLQLFPYQMKNLSYKNDKLNEITSEFWDLQNSEWKYSNIERYSYSGDTVFREVSFWDVTDTDWNKNYRQIIVQNNTHDDIIRQIWDKTNHIWINNSKRFYTQSEVEGYWNHYYGYWNDIVNEWDISSKTEYSYDGDTIDERRQLSNGIVYINKYLYNNNGDLLVYKSFQWAENDMILLQGIINNYNNDNILLTSAETYYVVYGSDDTISYYKEYFWDELVGVDEIIPSDMFRIIPNPVQFELNINTTLEVEEVRIYDINGHLLKTSPNTKVLVDDLFPGIYIVKIRSDLGETVSGKFVKS